jgi:hypothetical protein
LKDNLPQVRQQQQHQGSRQQQHLVNGPLAQRRYAVLLHQDSVVGL